MARASSLTETDHKALSDAEVLDQAEYLVDDFLAFIRREEVWNDILDVNTLAVSKTTLVNAFRLVIATDARPGYRRQLAKAGLMLARFHKGVGPKMSLIPVRAEDASRDAAIGMSKVEQQDYLNRFDAAYSLVGPDLRRLGNLFEASMKMAERREMRRQAHRDTSGFDEPYTGYCRH